MDPNIFILGSLILALRLVTWKHPKMVWLPVVAIMLWVGFILFIAGPPLRRAAMSDLPDSYTPEYLEGFHDGVQAIDQRRGFYRKATFTLVCAFGGTLVAYGYRSR